MQKNNFPLNINVMAVGNRGCNVLERLTHISKQNIKRSAVAIPGQVFNRLKIKNKIALENQSLLSVKDKITEQIENNDVIFLLTNLANPAVCEHTKEIARLAKEKDVLVFLVVSTPFSFEGNKKIEVAGKMKAMLENEVDVLLVVDNEKILKQDITAKEAFTQVDKVTADMIIAITDLVIKYGIVNVDFADLKTTLKNAGEVFFNDISIDKNDVDNLVEQLFRENNLNSVPDSLDKVLYVIYAGKNVLMEEINIIGNKIQERLSDSARVIFGVVNDEKFKDKFKITMIGV